MDNRLHAGTPINCYQQWGRRSPPPAAELLSFHEIEILRRPPIGISHTISKRSIPDIILSSGKSSITERRPSRDLLGDETDEVRDDFGRYIIKEVFE